MLRLAIGSIRTQQEHVEATFRALCVAAREVREGVAVEGDGQDTPTSFR